jgi:hypothetical protein
MKVSLFTERLPEVSDYALAIVISSIPGFAEADNSTKALYQPSLKSLLPRKSNPKVNLPAVTSVY